MSKQSAPALQTPGVSAGAHQPRMSAPSERILMVPGPSNVHPSVQQALVAPLVGHRDPFFLELIERVAQQLRGVFMTSNPATFALPATGGSGMEAALMNLIEPGDPVVIGVGGYFAERMVDIARRLEAEVTVVSAEWGQVVDPERLFAAVDKTGARVLAVVHGETSTGVCQPLEDIGQMARSRDVLLVIDAVASLGGIPLRCDEIGVDICFSGSQKCLSAPPGLAPITLSPRAMERISSRKRRVPTFYFDLSLHARYWSKEHIYHHTGPVLSVYALHQALALIEEEGLQAVFSRHALNARALTAGLEALGLRLLPEPADRLVSVLAVLPPDGIDEARVRDELAGEYGIDISGGLGAYTGRMWRIGVMGYSAQRRNVMLLLGALERLLLRQGHRAQPGAALAAAETAYSGG